jgi:hypothetical protein
MLFAVGQLAVCEAVKIRLPVPAQQAVPFLRWFNSYWWVTLVALALATPVVGLITYWVLRRVRSSLWYWAWGAVLFLPPLLFSEVVGRNLFAVSRSLAHVLRERREEVRHYLSPDGRELRWPLKLINSRGGPRPGGEILLIEPDGAWRVTPLTGAGPGPPLRRGKLAPARLSMLAHHLAAQDFLSFAEEGGPMPAAGTDWLAIEFGPHRFAFPGVRRGKLRDLVEPQGWSWEVDARFAALVLVVEDMIKEDRAE